MRLALTALFWSFVLCFAPAAVRAQLDDEQLAPGLLATFTAEEATVRRTDPDVSFVWGRDAPDERLPAGPFRATWGGQLLIREQTKYTFHAFVAGQVEVRLDGAVVLHGQRAEPGWVSGTPAALDFGFRRLEIRYERGAAQGRLHVFWSSDRFPLEPLPPHLLFLDRAEPDLVLFDRGRTLYDAHRCNRCHRRDGEPLSPPAPSLKHVAVGTNPAWLTAKLRDANPESAHAFMPSFAFSNAEAEDVAHFLVSVAQEAALDPVPKVKDTRKDPLPEGDLLLRSVGCLACHRAGELGESGPYGGGDLSRIGAKRSRDWLHTYLGDPGRLNPHARMPAFKLSTAERAQLAGELARLGNERDAAFTTFKPHSDRIERGRELVRAARCAACHEVPGLAADVAGIPKLDEPVADWSQSCLGRAPDRTRSRPVYARADRPTLRAYVAARHGELSPPGEFALGQLVLKRRNCLACHERNGDTGIVATAGRVAGADPRLAGQSQALIPPNLSAVGDKLLPEALAKAVGGEQEPRMPWLKVRMPRFTHSDDERRSLLAYLTGHDRIPDEAPASLPAPGGDASPETLIAGRALVGATGWSCIACHEFGEYVPPNVAIATHGSDLLDLSKRIRPEYFLRWTRSPLRIVPGMEMPSYERPVPGVLDGHADTQLAAIWQALNDPRFTVPTNPAAVEQLLAVLPGERPRVIRDVFTASKENGGGYVPRALAIGFDNGHSVLFDLDRACVREWTLGEFARQRTQGKSWFWDMAGAAVASGFDDQCEFILRRESEWVPLVAPSREEHVARLRSYRSEGDGVAVFYDLSAASKPDAAPSSIRIEDRFAAIPDESTAARAGWSREIAARDVPAGCELWWTRPTKLDGLASRLEVVPGTHGDGEPCGDNRRAFRLSRQTDGTHRLVLRYQSTLPSVQAQPKPPTESPHNDAPVTTAPGLTGVRLRLPASIMPTALAWTDDGTLAFTSLKGHVYLARDTDGDGLEDALTVFEEGLAAPFGILADGKDLLVAHKPELLRLRDTDGDGRCDERIVVADGWGYTHDYHDWTTGPVRDANGNLFLAISSDYQQAERDRRASQWRGKVLRLDTQGRLEPYAHELRFPMGIALDAAGRLFVSDQQGVGNTFNEIDHVVAGGRYGVPALSDPPYSESHDRAAIQVPHPWTRSVNGIFFLPPADRRADFQVRPAAPATRGDDGGPGSPPYDAQHPLRAFAGHGIGCEYNGRFLIRFTTQEVDGHLQGAVYEFTRTAWDHDAQTFLGPICGGLSPRGDLYVGSIYDSGWLGGRNTGEIVRLRPGPEPLPNGIRELRAVPGGFELHFIRPVDRERASKPENYSVSGYTRLWAGAYATPDSGRYTAKIKSVDLSVDATVVTLQVDELREQVVYDVTCAAIGIGDDAALWPNTAYYTMNRVPR
jgi:mono/diheme cytochrome c family protein